MIVDAIRDHWQFAAGAFLLLALALMTAWEAREESRHRRWMHGEDSTHNDRGEYDDR